MGRRLGHVMTRREPSIEGGGICGVFLDALVLFLGAALVSSCGPIAEPGDRTFDPQERVFSTARLVDVSVEIDPDYWDVLRRDTGTDEMRRIANMIFEGANAFLSRQYRTIAIMAVATSVIIGVLVGFLDNDIELGILTGVAFIVGAIASGVAGLIGMYISVRSNVRAAAAAQASSASGSAGGRPYHAKKRQKRSSLKTSSSMRAAASPTKRTRPAARSARPPWGS